MGFVPASSLKRILHRPVPLSLTILERYDQDREAQIRETKSQGRNQLCEIQLGFVSDSLSLFPCRLGISLSCLFALSDTAGELARSESQLGFLRKVASSHPFHHSASRAGIPSSTRATSHPSTIPQSSSLILIFDPHLHLFPFPSPFLSLHSP